MYQMKAVGVLAAQAIQTHAHHYKVSRPVSCCMCFVLAFRKTVHAMLAALPRACYESESVLACTVAGSGSH